MFNIEVDLKAIAGVQADIIPDISILESGIVSATQYIRDVWVSAVSGSVLPGMVRPVNDDQYAKSLSTGESMRFPSFLYGVVMPINYDDGVDKIENGFSSFDMKPGLLNGPKSRPTANGKGRFNTVPFRHYTPQANSSISVNLKMPTDVYSQAKRLQRSMPDENGKMKWGQSLDWDAPPAMSWTGYTHQSSISQGMYRIGSTQQTQYLTFRRVSSKSIPNSWIHPGLSANPLVEAVYQYTMPQVEKMLYELAEKAYG